MAKIDNPDKKIKIDSALFEEFSSPIKDNPNKYMKVDTNGVVQYLTPTQAGIDMGISAGALIGDWSKTAKYEKGQLVVYQNNIYRCATDDYVVKEEFDYDDWNLIAGYQKQSFFYKDDDNAITTITLNEAVSDKGFIQVNVDGTILQTDQYTLADDGVTVTFAEPIPAGSSINVLVYGNANIIKTSRTFSEEYIYGESTAFSEDEEGHLVLDVGTELLAKDLTYLNINNSQLLQSEWELSEDKTKIIFNNKSLSDLTEGDKVQVMSWENVEVETSVTFTPITSRDPERSYVTLLNWKSDHESIQPSLPTAEIYDGATYVPTASKTDYTTNVTFTNNQDSTKKVSIDINDGATYVPTVVENHPKFESKLTFKNNQTEEVSDEYTIYDGVTYTPHIDTNPDGQTSTIYYVNDKTGEKTQSTTFYTKYTKVGIKSFVIENDGQTTFTLDYAVKDKNLLWVNLENSEVLADTYDLSDDGLTITLKNGDSVKKGDMLDVKYFYNLVVGERGYTFTPVLTTVANGTELSWKNDGDLENPLSVVITNGKKGANGDSIIPCSAWDSTKDYDYLSIVTHEDGNYEYGYLCIDVAVAGTPLTDTQFWSQLYKVYKPSYIDSVVADLQRQIDELKS